MIKMKVLQTVQKNFAVLGINPKRINPKQSKSDGKIVMTWLILSLATTSSAIFLLVEAKTFQEYTNNIYSTSAGAVLATTFTIVIFKMEKLFESIDSLEDIIDKSELVLNILFRIFKAIIKYSVPFLLEFLNHKIKKKILQILKPQNRKQSMKKPIGLWKSGLESRIS